MDMSQHNIETLFEQLGLDATNEGIESFIENHHIPANVKLDNAPFWNRSQAAFISDSLREDSDWSEVVDQLDAMLRK
mgnify:CR=1 FL=1